MAKEIAEGIYGFSAGAVILNKKTPQHTETKISKGNTTSGKVVAWGDDNTSPQNLFKKLVKTDAAAGGLDVLTSAHFGTGFKLYEETETEKGVEMRERSVAKFPQIFDFFERVRWQVFLSDVISDFETFNIAFPEYLLSPDKSKVISVKRHPAAHCRLGLPHDKKGYIEKVYINTDWDNYDDKMTEEVHFFTPDTNMEELKAYCKKKNIDRFIIPVISTLTTEKVYPVVKWHSSFRNGWVDVVLSVPEFKKYMFENQLNVKYVVYVADDFFSHKFGKQIWNDFSAEEKEKKRKELVNKIDEHMSGNESSGRSLIAPYFRDTSGNLIKGIEVEPIDDKIKDGGFLPDAASGNSQVLFSMGVDPCLLGAGIPGGKSLSGSGSDKREAYTILCTRMPIKRLRTLEIFTRIRNWNGWERSLVGNFPNIVLTTLDKETSGQKEVVN